VKILVWFHSVDAVSIIFTCIMRFCIYPAKILRLHWGHRTSCTKRNSNTGNYIPNLSCKDEPDYESKTKHACTLQQFYCSHLFSKYHTVSRMNVNFNNLGASICLREYSQFCSRPNIQPIHVTGFVFGVLQRSNNFSISH